MTIPIAMLCTALVLARYVGAQERFSLTGGTIIYVDPSGRQLTLDVGRECTDLWVAPDDSVIAFVAIERLTGPEKPALPNRGERLIEQSSIYVARRSDNFKLVLATSGEFDIAGRSWAVLRYPSISPDGRKLFFAIPYTMTTWKVMSRSLPSGGFEMVGDATDYCVVWNGKFSGDLLIQQRHFPADPVQGVAYRCSLKEPSGASVELEGDCSPFRDFAARWSRQNGAACSALSGVPHH